MLIDALTDRPDLQKRIIAAVRVGDRVLVSGTPECGHFYHCLNGEPSRCNYLGNNNTPFADTLGPTPTPERLRALRAVMVLEQIGTPEARQLLEKLSKGAEGALLTEDAKAAVRRMKR